jgi:cytochrome c biogenesis protein CcmG/thiol:disulfide interchange protein DsbE
MLNDEAAEPLRNRTGRLTLVFLALIAAGLAVGAGLLAPANREEADLPMVGQPAPEVVVDLFGGGEWRLSEHLGGGGNPVLLNLWASWCEPCEEEIPTISDFALDHPELTVVGVAVRDDREAAAAFAERLAPAYPMGFDAGGRLRDRYIGFGLPAVFLIDSTGIVVAQLEGGAERVDLDGLTALLG